jgi:hypothetical protein
MALDQIRLGTPPSGQDGDDARTAFTRCNTNFASLDNWGITGPMTRVVSNYNDAIAAGWHGALQGTELNRPPNVTYGLIHVGVYVGGYVVQDAIDMVTGRSATRGFNSNNGEWSAWRPNTTTDQLGTAAFANVTVGTGDPTAGRLLKVGDTGILGVLPSYAGDANALAISIEYWTVPGFTNGPPSSTYGYLTHKQSSNLQYAVQEWRHFQNNMAWRRNKNAGTWSNWTRVYTADTSLGTVTQTLGIPTGAIIESGSNANGVFTKYSDGSLICSGDIQLPAQAMSTDTFITATFAAAFATGPRVVYSPAAEVGQGGQSAVGLVNYNGTYYSTTSTTWTLRSYSYRSSTPNPVSFRYLAHGRWF